MEYPSVFDLISEEFEKAGIPFLLIGGFAVNFYKVSRNTGDIDFLLAVEDSGKAMDILKKNGYQQQEITESFARFKNVKPYLMDTDLIFVDQQTLEPMIRQGKEIKITGCKFIVPALEHLIALKLHAIKSNPNRELKDMPDIIQLALRNGWDIRGHIFQNLCNKYGSPKIYDRIQLMTPSKDI